ncbi:MAG TPA: hypothetical protein PKC49_08180, partial [Phycisphaerae bacterium]|nr:hypothetical protein [Phycisphaerae bacterium]
MNIRSALAAALILAAGAGIARADWSGQITLRDHTVVFTEELPGANLSNIRVQVDSEPPLVIPFSLSAAQAVYTGPDNPAGYSVWVDQANGVTHVGVTLANAT